MFKSSYCFDVLWLSLMLNSVSSFLIKAMFLKHLSLLLNSKELEIHFNSKRREKVNFNDSGFL